MKPYMHIIALLLLVLPFSLTAQVRKERLQPGRIYGAGETLYAPRLGFTAQVPQGWAGTMPRENEVFLLVSVIGIPGEIYVFGRMEGDLSAISEAWKKGGDLDNNIRLVASDPRIENGMLLSEVVAEGPALVKKNKGFAASRCGDSGPCISVLAVAPGEWIDAVAATARDFLEKSSFEAPSLASPYADFDWRNFLSGKLMIAYTVAQGGTRENQVHLCGDGTFSARLSKTGWMRQTNNYRGNQRGTWTAQGIGETGLLRLDFNNKKLAPVELKLFIEDEKVYVNDERYFASQSDRCN